MMRQSFRCSVNERGAQFTWAAEAEAGKQRDPVPRIGLSADPIGDEQPFAKSDLGSEESLEEPIKSEQQNIMSLLGILFGTLMLFLIGKALAETIWGLLLMGLGILCLAAGWILGGAALIIRILARLNKAAAW